MNVMSTPDGLWVVKRVKRDTRWEYKVTYRGRDLIPYGSKRVLLTEEDVRQVMSEHVGGDAAFKALA
jgi:hypothetical protein